MKLQIAIDRVDLDQLKFILNQINGYCDIVEVGTSLIKDFGNQSIVITQSKTKATILADLKTMDQGRYEFESAFKHGADFATVMGTAPLETIDQCYQVAKELGKEIVIDLLETNDEKISQLLKYDDAIFCAHQATDAKGKHFLQDKEFLDGLKKFQRVALAGGIKFDDLDQIKEISNVEIVVIGSAITKGNNIREFSRLFYRKVHGQ